jgi:hypothetical protein
MIKTQSQVGILFHPLPRTVMAVPRPENVYSRFERRKLLGTLRALLVTRTARLTPRPRQVQLEDHGVRCSPLRTHF